MKSKFIIPCHQVTCHNTNVTGPYRIRVEGQGIHTHTLDISLQHMSRLSTVNTNTTPNSRTQIHVSERFFM